MDKFLNSNTFGRIVFYGGCALAVAALPILVVARFGRKICRGNTLTGRACRR